MGRMLRSVSKAAPTEATPMIVCTSFGAHHHEIFKALSIGMPGQVCMPAIKR
jgi:hypothetical protein